jgi:hypothetical protein
MLQDSRENQNTHLRSLIFSYESRAVHEKMWKIIKQPDRPQMTIRHACRVTKARIRVQTDRHTHTHTHTQYVLLYVFPLQQCLRERACVYLCYVYCLSCYLMGE